MVSWPYDLLGYHGWKLVGHLLVKIWNPVSQSLLYGRWSEWLIDDPREHHRPFDYICPFPLKSFRSVGFVCHVTCDPTTYLLGRFSVPETSPVSVLGTIRFLHHHRLGTLVAPGHTSHEIPHESNTCVSEWKCVFCRGDDGTVFPQHLFNTALSCSPIEISDSLVLVHIFPVGSVCMCASTY